MERGRPGEAPVNEIIAQPGQTGEFAASFLRKLRGKESFESEDSEESEESTPTKRWRRFFGRIFTRTTTVEHVETPDRPVAYERLFQGMPLFAAEAEPDKPDEPPVSVDMSPSSRPEQLFTEPQAGQPPVEQLAVVQPELPQRPTTPAEHMNRIQPEAVYLQPEMSEQPVYEVPQKTIERTEAAYSQAVRAERLASTATVLTGIEYLGRKRADKKIKTEVNKLKATIEQGKERQIKLERLQQSSRQPESLVMPPQEREAVRPIVTPERKPEPITIVERSPQVEVRRTFERSPERFETAAVRPEQIVEKVMAAAEVDKPIEKSYERSHEIKSGNAVTPAMATAIGGLTAHSVAQAQLTEENRKRLAKAVNKAHQAHETSNYKKAAQTGFWTAVTVTAALIAAAIVQSQIS